MGLFDKLGDMAGMVGGMGGFGDIEKMGKNFVDHMTDTKAGIAAILENQRLIMNALQIAQHHVTADDFKGVVENAG